MLTHNEIDVYNALLDICAHQDGATLNEICIATDNDKSEAFDIVDCIISKGMATSIADQPETTAIYPIANGEKVSVGIRNYTEQEIETLKLKKQ